MVSKIKRIKRLLKKCTLDSSRKYLELFVKEAAASLPAGRTVVLDAGAGHCPYASLFSHVIYETADFCKVDKAYGGINYVCDLSQIPVAENKYDMVICTQTLEHIPEPKKVLKEFYRILKPGGKLLLSVPLFYEEHEIPFDYYRYTQFGLQHLLGSVHFDIKTIEKLEGYYGTLSYQLGRAAMYLPFRPYQYKNGIVGIIGAAIALFLKPIFFVLSIYFAHLDIRYKFVSKGYCLNYAVIAVKKDVSL